MHAGVLTHTVIGKARNADLVPLCAAFGDKVFYGEYLRRHKTGRGVLLVARQGDAVVGTVYEWLEPAMEPEIRQHLPSVPLLTHLKVRPEYRDQGIGTQLVEAVETDLRGRGYSRVALAVTTDNIEATRLYERLGYREWDYGFVVCKNEVELFGGEESPEKCLVLVKPLTTRAAGTAPRSSRPPSPHR